MLALAVMQFPFGINAIIGVIGSIGVSINAAIIILTGLKGNARAAMGDTDAMAQVVTGSSRHIISTTITTFGGFLPLILAGGGFWPPFAVAIAGGVLLSAVVSFYFVPPMFALIYAPRRKTQDASRNSAPAGASMRGCSRVTLRAPCRLRQKNRRHQCDQIDTIAQLYTMGCGLSALLRQDAVDLRRNGRLINAN